MRRQSHWDNAGQADRAISSKEINDELGCSDFCGRLAWLPSATCSNYRFTLPAEFATLFTPHNYALALLWMALFPNPISKKLPRVKWIHSRGFGIPSVKLTVCWYPWGITRPGSSSLYHFQCSSKYGQMPFNKG